MMHNFLERLRKEAASLCRHVAPELGPVYVAFFHELRLPQDFGCCGLCVNAANYELELRERSLWRGNGVGFVINMAKVIRATKAYIGGGARGRMRSHVVIRNTFLAWSIHELGHLLDETCRVAEPSVFREFEMADLVRHAIRVDALSPAGNAKAGWPPWYMHEAAFLRAAIHVIARAQSVESIAPFDVSPADVVDTDTYELSSIGRYVGALGDEPWRLRKLTFAEIAGMQPPGEFVDLWDADRVKPWKKLKPAYHGELFQPYAFSPNT